MTHRKVCLWAICLVVLLPAISSSRKVFAQAPKGATANTITLGIVSGAHQREIADHFAPFISYVSQKVFATADARGRVLVASSLPDLANLLASKDIDFFMESAYPTYVIDEVHGAAKLLLRRWQGGMAEYRSLIATVRDSGIRRIENLRGKMIAFEDPESTSG
jgi:ABC-type phosphate/phosphonate transport system substrate-binding protein